MTPSLRLAAAAAAALGCLLWVAFGGLEADPGGALQVRPTAAERADERARGTASLPTVRAKERKRTQAPSGPAAAASSDAQPPPGFRVTGRVRADSTFSPDAVTTVWAYRPGASKEEARSVKASSRAPREWAFGSLTPGSWVFTAFVVEGERVALGSVGPVDVLEGGAHLSIEALEYSVSGVVTDSSGQPIEGVPVSLSWTSSDRNSLPRQHYPPRFAGATEAPWPGSGWGDGPLSEDNLLEETDAMGRFSFTVAGPGSVELLAPAVALIGWEASFINLQEGAEGIFGAFDFEPSEGGTVDLTTSFRVNVAQVDTSSPATPQSMTVVASPALGELDLDELAIAELLRVSVQPTAPDNEAGADPDWLTSSIEVELTRAEPRNDQLTLQLYRTARLRGRLRADAGSPEGINCFLRLLSKDAPSGVARQQQVSTDENGEFAFERCVPGEYFLYARSGGESGQDYSLRLALTLEEGEERYLTDRLTPSARISGVVHDRAGRPLVGVAIVATGCRNSNLTRRATTDASGMYTLGGLYEGVYELKLAILPDPVERLIIEVPAGGAVIEAGTLVASDT